MPEPSFAKATDGTPGFDARIEPLADSPAQAPEDLGDSYMAYRQEVTARSELDALLERVRQRRRPMAEPDVPGGGPAGDRPLSETAPGAAQEDAQGALGAAAADIGRGLVEAPRQAVAGALDGAEATGDLLEEMFPVSNVDTGERQLPEIDQPESVTGGLIRGTAQFLVGFIPALRAARGLKAVQGAGVAGELAAGAAAGAAADFAVFDPHEARLTDLLLELGLPRNAVTDFLKADPEDSEIEGRFKNLIEGAGIGTLADGVFMAAKTIQRARAARPSTGSGRGTEEAPDPLATQRERFGELGERDFMILGDPNEPLFKVEAKAPESGAAKLKASEAAVAEGAPAPARLARPEDLGGREVFVNFSRIDAAEDVQAVIGQMADAFSGDIAKAQRGKQSFEQTAKLADELGLSVPDLLARRQGQPFNAEEALAARRLWSASAEKLLETARAAADPNAGAVDQFNFRRMLAVHHAVQAEVIGARTETARALNAWKIPAGGGVERAREVQLLLESFGGPEASAEIAKKLAILEATGAGPEVLGAIARRGWAATTADAIKEVWVNGLLSSPKTHVVNISSNLGVAFQQILERGAAGRIAALRGAPDGVASGEAAAMAYGQVMALKDAFRLAWQATLADRTGAALGKIDLPRRRAVSAEAFDLEQTGAMGRAVDFLGNAFRVPGRLLGAEDEFFKTIGYRGQLHAHSLRQATSEGLQGEAFYLRIGELVANPPEHIRIDAADAALYSTFTNQPGWFGQAVMAMRGAERAGSPVPFVLPFVRTPVNIARYAFERTPLAPLVGQWRADVAAGGARRDLALARLGLGSAVMLVAADYADLGLVSGRGPQDTGEREALRRQGWKPYAIKVGGHWVSYNRADPFGMTMGFAADIAEAVKRGELDEDDVDEWQEVMAMSIAAVSSVAVNKTYLSGMAEFTQMMADPTRYSERYVNDFVGSFVPFTSVMRAGRLAADPELKEVLTPFDAVSDRIILLSDRLTTRRDLWGQGIKLESGLGRTYDFFAPWSASAVVKSPIDAELLRLGADIRRIPKKTSFAGVNVNLKNWPDVYDDYTRLAGNGLKHIAWNLGARDLLDRIVEGRHPLSQVYQLKSDGKDGGKAAMIRNLIGEYRGQAQRAILADPKHAAFADHIETEAEEKRRLELPGRLRQGSGGPGPRRSLGEGGPRIGDAP